MATRTLAQLIAGARQYANVESSLFVEDAVELPARTNEAVAELYDLVVSAYEHYYVSSHTFTLAGGTSGNTFDTRGLTGGFFKDNTLENTSDPSRPRLVRRIATFMSRHRGFLPGYALVGDFLTVYPADNSAGTYRLYYTPDPPVLVTVAAAKFTGTHITAAALPACTAAGAGVGKTLTANAVGILTVDGVNLLLNDTVLVKDQANAIDNGFYTVTTAGTAGIAFVLTRNTAYDQAAEVAIGDTFGASVGTVNASRVWQTATFTAFDTAAITFTENALDATLTKWFPYIELHVARYILDKREMDSTPMNGRLGQMRERVMLMARNRTEEAEQAPLNDGSRLWWGDGSELP